MDYNFDYWDIIKKKVHFEKERPMASEGDIWWAHIGHNIGVENNGKDKDFIRPVFILRVINKYSVIAIPITSTEHNGLFYGKLFFNNKKHSLMFHQVRALDTKRLTSRIGTLRDFNVMDIKKQFVEKIIPTSEGEVGAGIPD